MMEHKFPPRNLWMCVDSWRVPIFSFRGTPKCYFGWSPKKGHTSGGLNVKWEGSPALFSAAERRQKSRTKFPAFLCMRQMVLATASLYQSPTWPRNCQSCKRRKDLQSPSPFKNGVITQNNGVIHSSLQGHGESRELFVLPQKSTALVSLSHASAGQRKPKAIRHLVCSSPARLGEVACFLGFLVERLE